MRVLPIVGVIVIVASLAVPTGIIIAEQYAETDENPSNNDPDVTLTTTTIDTDLESGDNETVDIEDYVQSTGSLYTSGESVSTGTGFLYTEQHVVTNEHVVDSGEVDIKFTDGLWASGEVVGADEHTDIAVIELDEPVAELTPLPVAETLPSYGDRVKAIGSPSSLHDTVTTGVVSALERNISIETEFSIPDTIQTDAALNPGNSGGPLVSVDSGEVVGIVRATEGENIGYATSGRMADGIIQSLIETGDHQHGFIGVTTQNVNPITEDSYDNMTGDEGGIVVSEVQSETPADETLSAEPPDIITHVDGEKIQNNEDLGSYLLRNKTAGDTITLTIIREGELETVDLTLDSR